MLKHKDPEVQYIIDFLESQRDYAVSQAAVHFRDKIELVNKIKELEQIVSKMESQNVVKISGKKENKS
jgi:hypothetical protein